MTTCFRLDCLWRAGLVCVLLVLFLGPQEASAQRWVKTAQLEVKLEQDGYGRALLDSLTNVLARRDSLTVSRGPDSSDEGFLAALRGRLIEEKGIGLTSASHMRIDYRFTIEGRDFKESIEAIHFLFRRAGAEEESSLLHLDGASPWVRALLRTAFYTSGSNCASPKSFYDVLSFAQMYRDGRITKISGNDVRDGFERKKRKIAKKIQRLTYESM